MTENAIAKEIVDAAFRIHTTLGPGLLESVYNTVLACELGRRGLRVVRQQPIPVVYDVRIDTGFRADLIVGDKVIVEVKSVENLAPVHKNQLLTYLPGRQRPRRRPSREVPKPQRHPAVTAAASPRDFKGGALAYTESPIFRRA
jgi:GxxExxY protein